MPYRRQTRFERNLPGDDRRVEARGAEDGASPPRSGPGSAGWLGCAIHGSAWCTFGVLAYQHLDPFVSNLGLQTMLALFAGLLGWLGLVTFALTLRDLLRPLRALQSLVGGAVLVGVVTLLMIPAWPGEVLESVFFGAAVFEARNDALEDAIEEDDVDRVRILVEAGLGDLDPRDLFGEPLLHKARGADMLAALLDGGLDPNVVDDEGRALLMKTDDPEIARALLTAGAAPDLRDPDGRTALMFAVKRYPAIASLLLEAGANPAAIDLSGRSVTDHAGDEETRAMLGKAAASRNPRPGALETSL